MKTKLCTAVLILIASFNAQAQTYPEGDGMYNTPWQHDFRLADNKTYCGGDRVANQYDAKDKGWNGVSCLTRIQAKPIQPIPADCDLDWGDEFQLDAKDKPNMSCHGDFAYTPKGRVLKTGETIKGNGWQCTAKKGGSIYCINSQKHGFEISPKKQRMF